MIKAAHPNDITGVMSEMSGFETAFDNAINYAKTHKDTLVVATRPLNWWSINRKKVKIINGIQRLFTR